MTSLERRLLALEDDGGRSRVDRLADVVVLLLHHREEEADPGLIDEARELLDKRPWGDNFPPPLTISAFVAAIGRVLPIEEVEDLLRRLAEFDRLKLAKCNRQAF